MEENGYDEFISIHVKDVVDRIVNTVVANITKSKGANKNAAKRRHQYTASFKAPTINEYKDGLINEQ